MWDGCGLRGFDGGSHARMISQLHQLLADLIPGGAKKNLSAAQAKVLLAGVWPGIPPGRPAAGSLPS